MRDRRLGIPGEDLPGSHAATDFVNWYCGHPDVDPGAFALDAESVAVIGVGNVAVDVARILARDPAELEHTDIPEPVMEALRASRSARCTSSAAAAPRTPSSPPRNCASSVSCPACTCRPTRPSSTWTPASTARASPPPSPRRTGASAATWSPCAGWACQRPGLPGTEAARPLLAAPGRNSRIIIPNGSGLRLERTRLDESGAFEGTGEIETLDAQLVLRRWATSPSRCPASRSTPARTRSPTPAAGSCPSPASRSPASTSRAG